MNKNLINEHSGALSTPEEKVLYVKECGEITQEDLGKISGGLPAARYSKTIVVDPGYTDVDAGF